MWDTRDRWDQDDDVFAPVVDDPREALALGGVTLTVSRMGKLVTPTFVGWAEGAHSGGT